MGRDRNSTKLQPGHDRDPIKQSLLLVSFKIFPNFLSSNSIYFISKILF